MADFNWNPEEFGETNVYRYRCESFNQLTLKQKQLVKTFLFFFLKKREAIESN
jgi:hypothetical protein